MKRIIKAPDGTYGIYCTSADSFDLWEATANDVVADFELRALKRAQKQAREEIAAIDAGQDPYKVHMIDWREAATNHNENSSPEDQISL